MPSSAVVGVGPNNVFRCAYSTFKVYMVSGATDIDNDRDER